MHAAKVFFSFTEITDPSKHRDYNAWHQLDHRPENLALPGVIYGERWVRTPDCAEAGQARDPRFEHFHYLNMYWFREPVDQSRREWQDLGSRSFQWGRRPELAWAKRNLLQFCDLVKGYVNPRVLVSAEVLPFRPTRGIWLTVSQVAGDVIATEDLYRWYDEVRIPDMLACRGCAGAWTFVSEEAFGSYQSPDRAPTLRIHVYFLDEDPLDVAADLAQHEARWRSARRSRDTSGVEEVLFDGPLRVIIPWQWDWFDELLPG
ncbi:MAG TPA: hypothetical protein VKQ71_09115 [Acidimicrobiales bacterium]|nr:hypothetical protein [Acidimicrobiales bacterium]